MRRKLLLSACCETDGLTWRSQGNIIYEFESHPNPARLLLATQLNQTDSKHTETLYIGALDSTTGSIVSSIRFQGRYFEEADQYYQRSAHRITSANPNHANGSLSLKGDYAPYAGTRAKVSLFFLKMSCLQAAQPNCDQIYRRRVATAQGKSPTRPLQHGFSFSIPELVQAGHNENKAETPGIFTASTENGFVISQGDADQSWWCDVKGSRVNLRF